MLSKIKSKTLQDLLKVLSGNIVSQGIGFLSIVIISRDLGPEQYGVFSLFIAIFTISIQIADFGVSTSYIKYVSENLQKAKEIFQTVVLSKLVLSLAIIFILFFLSSLISLYFFGTSEYAHVIEFISLSVFFHVFFGVVVSHFQAIQKIKVFTLLNISHQFLKFISILFIAVMFNHQNHLEGFVLSYAYMVVFILFAILVGNVKKLNQIKAFHFYHFAAIYKLGFWIFLSSLATVVMMRLDMMMLQKMSNANEVGFYSVAMNLALIFPLITTSLVTTLLPKLDLFLKEKSIKEYIFKILSNIKYIIGILLFLEIISPLLIRLLFGNDYIESVLVFQILIVAFAFGILINPISLVMYSIDKAYLLTLLNWIQLPLNYVGNLLLIPLMQAEGAAISTTFLKLFGGIYILYLTYYFAKGNRLVQKD